MNIRQFINKTILENYPSGAEQDSRAPWNQNPSFTTPKKPLQVFRCIKKLDPEFFLLEKDGQQYIFSIGRFSKNELAPYAEIEQTYTGKDEDGDPQFDQEDFTIDESVVEGFVNDNLNTLTTGYGLEGYENGEDITQIDDVLHKELSTIFSL